MTPPPREQLRVGECLVDVPLREVHVPGARRPHRITPKAMSVLLALVDNAGKVVSRDALLAAVWPDTLPTNDVITQAITSLRKALGEERNNPRYIETIAKTGYRLLAVVDWLDQDAAPAPTSVGDPTPAEAVAWRDPRTTGLQRVLPAAAPELAARPRARWQGLAWAAAFAAVLVASVALWTSYRGAPGEPPAAAAQAAPYRLITSLPGPEITPSLSPDAALVAYVAVPSGQRNTAVMVQTTDPSPPRQLTRPPAASDDSAPAWSPDGREIAFLRIRSGQDCRVMVVPANGGIERRVGACDYLTPPSFDWTHDGRGLVFGSRGALGDNAGLRILDLASGAWRKLDYPATADDIDAAPHYSPDGRWIVFVRNSTRGDFWRLPAAGGTASRLTELRADIRGWDWTPDGRGIVYARWSNSQSRLYRLDLETGVSSDLGVADGTQPTMATKTAALAFSQQRNYYGIYRFDLGAGGGLERLFPSSGRDRLPAIAPDGRQLVFASDRSGEFGLWWSELHTPNALRLIDGVVPESRQLPEWSPDSRTVLVVGTDRGNRTPGLYEVVPASDQVRRLDSPVTDPVQAVYLPGTSPTDARRLLVIAGTQGGRLRLTLFDRDARPWRALASIDDVALVRVDADRHRVLLTRPGQAGLWEADLALSPASLRQVDAERPVAASYRLWNVTADGRLYAIDRQPGCATTLRQAEDGATSQRCIDASRSPANNGFSVNTRANAAFVSLSEWLGGDIGFMALPPAPEQR